MSAAGRTFHLSLIRKVSQLCCGALFLYLFVKTDYSGSDHLDAAVNIIFRLDPFLAACAMLAAKTFIALFIPALITMVLTVIFGRFFCGWVCPMGGLLDLSRGLFRGNGQKDLPGFRIVKFLLLFFLLAGSLCGFPVAGYVDPFSILSLASGALMPLFFSSRSLAKYPDPELVRPPGALGEEAFLGRCVRCGECMKVCIGNGLQPTFLDAGLEGMFTPRLSARIGYCEFNCTLCGQVCPSGAIRKLTLAEKRTWKIEHAHFDRNLCLPYVKGIPCIVCEEHCPTPDKAIKFREVETIDSKGQSILVKQPFLVDELCIGCGICETKCPLPGNAAIRVTSAGETRDPENVLSTSGGGQWGSPY